MSSNPTKGMILLTGGTGKISSRITPLLSANGNAVLIASRSGTGFLNCRGIKFDWLDESTYTAPFDHGPISAIFLISPPIMNCFPPMKAFIDLAISRGVRRFVLLSASLLDTGDGPMMGRVAKYIKTLGVECTILQPTWFMENFSEMQHMHTIKSTDTIITATGEGKVPFVSADDIAAVAFRALTDEVPRNEDLIIFGPDLYSYDDVAALLSHKLGRKITHVKITEDELAITMSEYVPKDYARILAQLDTAIRNGEEERLSPQVVERVTGRKPVSFESFVDRCVGKGVWDKTLTG